MNARSPGTWDWLHNYKNILHACTYNSGCLCCKLLRKLVLHALSLLSSPSIKTFAGTCARSAATGTQKCQPSPLTRCGLCYRSSRRPAWCRRCSMRRTRPCPSDRSGSTKKKNSKKNRNRIVQKKTSYHPKCLSGDKKKNS